MILEPKLRLRRPNHNLSFKRRCGLKPNLTADDQSHAENNWHAIAALNIRNKKLPTDAKYAKLKKLMLLYQVGLMYTDDIPLEKAQNYRKREDYIVLRT